MQGKASGCQAHSWKRDVFMCQVRLQATRLSLPHAPRHRSCWIKSFPCVILSKTFTLFLWNFSLSYIRVVSVFFLAEFQTLGNLSSFKLNRDTLSLVRAGLAATVSIANMSIKQYQCRVMGL